MYIADSVHPHFADLVGEHRRTRSLCQMLMMRFVLLVGWCRVDARRCRGTRVRGGLHGHAHGEPPPDAQRVLQAHAGAVQDPVRSEGLPLRPGEFVRARTRRSRGTRMHVLRS